MLTYSIRRFTKQVPGTEFHAEFEIRFALPRHLLLDVRGLFESVKLLGRGFQDVGII